MRQSSGTSSVVYPLPDGGSIVRVSGTDLRRLDAKGKIVKSFGGGDGVLTPKHAANRIAVDPASGRIAVRAAVNGTAVIEFYKSDGTYERISAEIDDVGQMTFDTAGRLLIAYDNVITRMLPSTAAPDPAFGANGRVVLPADDLPAGHVFYSTDFDDEERSTLLTLAVVVGPTDGAITIVRRYSTSEPHVGFEEGQFLEFTRLDANGNAPGGVVPAASVLMTHVGFNDAPTPSTYRLQVFDTFRFPSPSGRGVREEGASECARRSLARRTLRRSRSSSSLVLADRAVASHSRGPTPMRRVVAQ